MRYIRTASLKRLFSLKRHSFDEELPKDCGFNSEENKAAAAAAVEPSEHFKKPTWKCFSFQEISAATNAFSSGSLIFSVSLNF